MQLVVAADVEQVEVLLELLVADQAADQVKMLAQDLQYLVD
jgi:hypothetical protein